MSIHDKEMSDRAIVASAVTVVLALIPLISRTFVINTLVSSSLIFINMSNTSREQVPILQQSYDKSYDSHSTEE